jgi:hypothetical protein
MSNNVVPDPQNVYNTNVRDFYSEVARGLVAGHSIDTMQGENLDVDVANKENLWCVGGLLVYPTAGEQWEVLSSSGNDTIAGGTGATMAVITYLDTDYIEQIEVVMLNGLTPVLTVATNMFRLQGLSIAGVGSSGFNEGTIDVRVANGGNPRACMMPTENNSLHGFYTVPSGKTAFITYGNASCKKADEAVVDFYLTNGTDGIFRRNKFADLFANTTYTQPIYPLGGIIEKSDIHFVAQSFNVNNEVSAFIQVLLIDNPVEV